MLFKKNENICLITTGLDRVGRTIVKIEQDQSQVLRQTGQFTTEPVKLYPSVIAATPDDALAADGWFHPTPEFNNAISNYTLQNMYDGNGQIRPCFTSALSSFDTLSTDKGRLSFAIASIKEGKDGSISLVCSEYVKKLMVNPLGQDAATKLAKDGSDLSMLSNAVGDVKKEREQAIENYPGGRDAVIKECNLRGIMHNQQIYQDYADPKEARAVGKYVQAGIKELYEAEMRGGKVAMAALDAEAFASAVSKISQKNGQEQDIS